MQAGPSRLAVKAARAGAKVKASIPSTSRSICSNSNINAPLASTSYLTHGSPSESRRYASSVPVNSGWIERPIPVQVADPSTINSDNQKGKGKAKAKGRPASERELPLRKQFLLQQYKQIFSSSPVVIFLKPSDFTVAEITKLRVDLSSIAAKSTTPSANDINNTSSSNEKPQFVFLRAGLLPPTFEQLPNLPSGQVLEHLSKHGSTLSALIFNTFDPPTLKAALKAVTKLSKSPNVRKEQAEAAAKAAAGPAGAKGAAKGAAGPVAGKDSSKNKTVEERLTVVSAIIDGKAVSAQELTGIADLPSLEQVLAQLVAVIETPARQIYQVAGQAAGQDLLRTLQGFKVGLEEKEDKSADAKET